MKCEDKIIAMIKVLSNVELLTFLDDLYLKNTKGQFLNFIFDEENINKYPKLKELYEIFKNDNDFIHTFGTIYYDKADEIYQEFIL